MIRGHSDLTDFLRDASAYPLPTAATAELARLDVRLQGATSEESDAQQGRA